MRASTAIESDVDFAVSLQGPPGVWDDDNPPPYGVIDSSAWEFTIKDGPDGSAGNIVPTVTVGQWHQQKLDGGVPEGTPVRFEVKSSSPAQGPFTVHLKVEQTGDCLAPPKGSDQVREFHTVSFAPRDGRTVLTVPTVDDDNAEQDCTVKASLADANGNVPGPGTTTEVRAAGSRFGYTIDTVGPTVNGNKFPPKASATATVRDDDSVALEDGASLVPKLEVGARHDGGDAETGFGVELGGGIEWTDPGMGLSLDLSGRTLIAHGNDDLKDRGFSAALAYDPAPATQRGASLSLRQDWGGKAAGGLDALFQPQGLDDRTGGGEATSRWAVEAAYGLPVFGGRWTGSPHVGLGLATAARDYSLGWRLAPEAANAPDLSFGVQATRRESDYAEPEHTVGLEIRATW